ncbi:Hypothetical predicted protein [Xyrichtys novacula]|uniref:Uncharacterized protein n=1 Tax=Xyrichtys novacula TaxID=13765 RepID=A0AAV1FUF8_XYRNO|nr:Hypothetical predicted protein [Xyrichtys novacula]
MFDHYNKVLIIIINKHFVVRFQSNSASPPHRVSLSRSPKLVLLGVTGRRLHKWINGASCPGAGRPLFPPPVTSVGMRSVGPGQQQQQQQRRIPAARPYAQTDGGSRAPVGGSVGRSRMMKLTPVPEGSLSGFLHQVPMVRSPVLM